MRRAIATRHDGDAGPDPESPRRTDVSEAGRTAPAIDAVRLADVLSRWSGGVVSDDPIFSDEGSWVRLRVEPRDAGLRGTRFRSAAKAMLHVVDTWIETYDATVEGRIDGRIAIVERVTIIGDGCGEDDDPGAA